MNLRERAEFIAGGARDVARQVRAQIEALLAPWRVARRLFLGPDGEPTEDAAAFFGQLDRACYVSRSTWHADPREHAMREGRRQVALEIMNMVRLDQAKLARLVAMAREDDDD